MGAEISEPLRRLVRERAFRVCEYCLVHEEDLYHGCEVDHIRSAKHGGLTEEANLALACFIAIDIKVRTLVQSARAQARSSAFITRGLTGGENTSSGTTAVSSH